MNDFLNKPVGDMTKAELTRLISQVIARTVPPIPASLLALADQDRPVLFPPAAADGQVLTYDPPTGNFQPETPSTATTVSDSVAPAAAAAPTVQGGLGYIAVKWTPVVLNAAAGPQRDTVIYEVHVSTGGSGFVTGAGTKAGETPGTMAFTRTDAAGADLNYGTDYWVKIVARDADGTAAASSAAGPVQLDPAGSQDILAGAVTAEHIESVFNYSSAFIAGTFPGANVQVGFGVKDDGTGNAVVDSGFLGVRAYDGDPSNTQPIFKLPADGSPALFRGVIQFGSQGTSQLLQNDMIQVQEQSGGTFADPLLIQTAASGDKPSTTQTCWFETQATTGNLIIAVLNSWDATGSATYTTPAGWALIHSAQWADSSNGRVAMFAKVATGGAGEGDGFSDPVSITMSKSCDVATLQLLEYSGVTVVEDVASLGIGVTANGVQPMNTTATGTFGQQSLLIQVSCAEGTWRSATHPSGGLFPGIRQSSIPVDRALVSQVEETDATTGILVANDIETNVYAKTVQSGVTDFGYAETNADSLSGFTFVAALQCSANAVQAADADTVRMYGSDIGGETYLHTIDELGRKQAVVLGSFGEIWRMEILALTKDIANVPTHGATLETFTSGISGLATGDFIMFLNKANQNRSLIVRSEPVCTVANQIVCQFFNADTADVNPASDTYYFLVIHRS